MPEMANREERPAAEPARDIAEIERRLRLTKAVEGHLVHVSSRSGRIYFDTWEPNPSTRGEILANVCSALGGSEFWELVTIHEPRHHDDLVECAVTFREASSSVVSEDALALEYDQQRGPRRRVRLVPQADGQWDRVDEEWSGCGWSPVGHEIVEDVSIERGGEVLDR